MKVIFMLIKNYYCKCFLLGSLNGLILASVQGILHCVFSALVIYGAAKQNRFCLVPWIMSMVVYILLNLYWPFACANVKAKLVLAYFCKYHVSLLNSTNHSSINRTRLDISHFLQIARFRESKAFYMRLCDV